MSDEVSFFKKYKKVILSIIILPLVASLIVSYMIFGNLFEALVKMWNYRGNPNITASSVTSLSYIFTILVAIYALCATTFFSKLVWKVSERSLLVSQQLQELEKNRDEEIVRENALIVYYDLQRGILNLRDLYINCVLKGGEVKPSRIYFSSDWIKNVANLRDGLTNQELNKVYKLYEQFYALQNILEEYKEGKQNQDLIEYIEELTKEVIVDFIPFPILDEIKVSSIDEMVDIDFYIILQKIYSLTYLSSERKVEEKIVNEKKVYETYLNESLFFVGDTKELFVGDGKLYNADGNIKFSGQFNSNQFVQGTVYGYYNSTKKCFEITYESSLGNREVKTGVLYKLTDDNNIQYFYNGEFQSGKIFNGFTTVFHNDRISYQGEVEDGCRNGQGTYYNEVGRLFEGIWENNVPVNGVRFNSGQKIFEGKVTYDLKPWTGYTYNYDLSYKVKKFTGEICEGQPINGKGIIYNVNKEGRDLFDLETYEEWREETAQEEDNREESPEYIESRAHFDNEYRRSTYVDWTEYIAAEWNEGVVTQAEDKEVYKTIL